MIARSRMPLAVATAVIAWSSVLVQLVLSVQSGMDRGHTMIRALVDYLSYFTVTTNTLVALALTMPALAPTSRLGQFFRDARVTWTTAGAIVVVGLAYHFLLSNINHPVGLGKVTDTGLHYLTPPLYAIYWVFYADISAVRWRSAVLSLTVYPTAYFAYLLMRGEVVHVYPYFFVDVATLGWAAVLRNAGGLLLIHLIIASVMLGIARTVRRLPSAATEPIDA